MTRQQGPQTDKPERVCVGAVAGAYGVRGEVRLKSFCAEPDAIGSYGPLWSEDGARSFDVTLGAPVAQGFAARLGGVRTREQAEALRGVRLFVDRARLPGLPDDEFYHADLIGLQVFDTGGAPMGRVKAVLNHGASDLLELVTPGQKGAVLLPFTRAIVPTVDLAAGRIVADPPEGLLE
ncbi:Ribosome maturation factor RimM [Roseibaca ekhonensis]|jgi:16S rRNA processing protein RimM|uniref:Ribosome maturation factor RimM n=1 Tax=Roseinatronobacter ekhonensis TaxID=254356 RepID=A0A3B0MPR2_9RHOB|nr:ribosome maturation factor RimM [Roseibaca ekhonensis]SUZ32997.1 Ribosome maturation factor RimM [Roseibaca ekhonensis]